MTLKCLYISIMLSLSSFATVSMASNTNWLCKFAIGDEYGLRIPMLEKLVGRPLVMSGLTDTNIIATYRVVDLNSWGSTAVTLDFRKGTETTNQNEFEVVCNWTIKSVSSRASDFVENTGSLKGSSVGDMLDLIKQHSFFSKPLSLELTLPKDEIEYTADGSSFIIEFWNPTSYVCITRPGVYSRYHEQEVTDYVRFFKAIAYKHSIKNSKED